MSAAPRYAIADRWAHIILERQPGKPLQETEPTFRFVLDLGHRRLAGVDIEHDGSFAPATSSHADDLLESLLHGHPYLTEEPSAFGLESSDRLPEWCTKGRAPAAATTEIAR